MCWLAHWAELDYGLSAGQHAVLPEGKGKGNVLATSTSIFFDILSLPTFVHDGRCYILSQ